MTGASSPFMVRGWLSPCRTHRRSIVHAVLFALLLPLLLAIAPQPSLSASATLERDLALSICSGSGADHPAGQDDHSAGHQQCILCASCATGQAPLLGGGSAAFMAAPRTTEARPVLPHRGVPPLLRAMLDARPPRGPPAALTA